MGPEGHVENPSNEFNDETDTIFQLHIDLIGLLFESGPKAFQVGRKGSSSG
jgi:hypothetical protein